MRHTRAIHLNIVSDEQYQELVNVAQELGDDAQSISVRLVNGLGTESTTGETTEGENGVLRRLWGRAPQGMTARVRTQTGHRFPFP